ncbi:hypothetical protein V8G54_033809 [Vigna mungo]|uniref:GDSL esterase/lipase n=1 Tax=Vigna mungo TaxID=3915 RepID=A0AAQ3RHY3_VIGMU
MRSINIIRISRQLQYFEQYQQRVSALIGVEQAQRLVNQALVLITLGGNDFVNNYFLVPFSARSRQFALPDYVVYLISEYRKILVAYGFITSKVACCGQGRFNGIGLCTPVSNLCPNRNVYAFWDPFHPSERANRLIVETFMIGDTKYMNPMNLSTIMQLDSRT